MPHVVTLWNKLPKELRQPVDDESLSLSSHLSLTSSSSSSSSPLSLCIAQSLFHSRLKTYVFDKYFLPQPPHLLGRISRILMTISGLNYSSVFICPVAIAYSMGQIIKSVCVCQSVSVSVCPSVALSQSHFLIDFYQNWHRCKNPQK